MGCSLRVSDFPVLMLLAVPVNMTLVTTDVYTVPDHSLDSPAVRGPLVHSDGIRNHLRFLFDSGTPDSSGVVLFWVPCSSVLGV